MSSKPGAMRRLLGLASAVAMVGAGIAPVAARDHGRHGWGDYGHHRHYRHRGGLDAGDVIGIAALIGAVAVIASAASKDRRDRERDSRSAPYPDGYPAERSDRRDGTAAVTGEDAAVDACVVAARDEAERDAAMPR